MLDAFSARQAQDGGAAAAIVLNNVHNAVVRNGTAQLGTTTYVAAAGTTRDTFELLAQGVKYGARVALFGRKIGLAESPLGDRPEAVFARLGGTR